MSEDIIFASDFLVDQMIFSLVAEDDMNFFGAWSANVWAKHQQVWCFTVQIGLLQWAIEDFQITTAAVNVLFMLHWELQHQWLVFVAEWSEFTGNGIESCILWCLKT